MEVSEVVRWILLGTAAGLMSGPLVGLADAVYVLTAVAPPDYLALIYGVLLYALAGAALGTLAGGGLAVAAYLRPSLLSASLGYTTAFLGVWATLAGAVAYQEVDRLFYLDQGIPGRTQALILGIILVVVLSGLWIGPILLTRTPFKIILAKRGTLAFFGVLVLLSAVFSFSPVAGGDPAGWISPLREENPELRESPNVLLVVVDSLRPDHLGAYGSAAVDTPSLNQLAMRGLVFEQAIAQSNWCRGSMASLFSAQVPSAHGVVDRRDKLDESVTTLAEVLQESGYVTGALLNHPDLVAGTGMNQGFDWHPYLAPRFPLWASQSASRLGLYRVVRRIRARYAPVTPGIEEYYLPSEVVFDQARHFVSVNRERPWFLVAHLMETHPPMLLDTTEGSSTIWAAGAPPSADAKQLATGAYQQSVRKADSSIGAFLRWLAIEGMEDNTLVVVTSTHGIALGERERWGTGGSLHDELIHIPLIVGLPSGKLAGAVLPHQVRQMDVAVTILHEVGATVPEAWQGNDLVGDVVLAVAGGGPTQLDAEEGDWSVNPASRAALAEAGRVGQVSVALRTDGWKLLRTGRRDPHAPARLELFQLRQDPGESVELGAREKAVLERLERQMMSRLQESRSIREGVGVAPPDEKASERMRSLGY